MIFVTVAVTRTRVGVSGRTAMRVTVIAVPIARLRAGRTVIIRVATTITVTLISLGRLNAARKAAVHEGHHVFNTHITITVGGNDDAFAFEDAGSIEISFS